MPVLQKRSVLNQVDGCSISFLRFIVFYSLLCFAGVEGTSQRADQVPGARADQAVTAGPL